jgi:hypothetical protein
MANPKVKTKTAISWDNQARKLRLKYEKLTDQDLYFEKGKMEEMLKRVQAKIGMTRHELYHMITNL